MRYGPRSAAPACRAMLNARWRGASTGCQCWPNPGVVPAFARTTRGERLCGDDLRRIVLIELVHQRGEGRERLGRERDRLAAMRGRGGGASRFAGQGVEGGADAAA